MPFPLTIIRFRKRYRKRFHRNGGGFPLPYTIRDIARLAGVSVTTVSRVINGRPDVKEETRLKVEDIIRENHFITNPFARGLKNMDAVVPVILRGQGNPFLNLLAGELLRRAKTLNCPLLIDSIDESEDEMEAALRQARTHTCQGLILAGALPEKDRVAMLEELNIPVVFLTVTAKSTEHPRIFSVAMDDAKIAEEGTRYLLSLGHRQLAVFGTGVSDCDTVALRTRGIRKALVENNASDCIPAFVPTRFSRHEAYQAALSFFPAHPEITAVFCMSDTIAIGVIRALYELGLRVPDDLSVLGIDGIPSGAYSIPSLTTLVQPVEELAEQALDMILEASNLSKPRHLLLDGRLEIRESTGSVRDHEIRIHSRQ